MRKRNHRIASLGLALLLAAAVGACGDVTAIEAEITPEILSGDWEATNVTITNISNPSQVVDLLAEGGALEFRFTLDQDVTIFVTPPEGETIVDTGTYDYDESFLYFIDPETEEVEAWAYDLQVTQVANSLTLATADAAFDFQGDGTPEPALFAVVMIR